MIIRTSRQGDFGEMYRITLESLDEIFQPDIFHYFQMQWPSGQLSACTLDDRPVGYLSAIRSEPSTARIMMFAVRPNARSKGIGNMLLSAFRQRAMLDGIRTITLEVRPANSRAISFYTRNGFSQAGTIERFYNDGGPAVKMILSI
jgi:Acetyltransferases